MVAGDEKSSAHWLVTGRGQGRGATATAHAHGPGIYFLYKHYF